MGTDMREDSKARPIRILHYLADINVASGVANVLMNYYKHINRKKLQFDFLFFEESPNNYEQEILGMGGRCFRIQKPGIKNSKEIKEFFAEHQGEYSVLHCHPVYASVVLGPFAKAHGVKKVFQHSHSCQYGNTKKSILRNFIISHCNFMIVDEYLACSEEAAKLLGWKFVWKNKVNIMHNAIDCERFRYNSCMREKIRNEYMLGEETVVVGHSGRFDVEKNHTYLLQVFSAYNKSNPHSKLMLLGDGPERENILRLSQEYGIEQNVIILGRKKDPESYLSAMDCFVFPSFYEGISLALIEAQCSGLPCYVSDTVDERSKQTNRYKLFSISSNPESVASILPINAKNADRDEGYNILKGTSYNLKNEADKLESYYLKACKK